MKLLYDNSGNSVDDMNFSIPADRAIFLAESFFQNKPYTRGKLGITIIDVIDLSLSNRVDYGVTLDYGLFVVDSGNDSFMENDIITKINGIEFTQKTQFQKELYNHYKNEPIEFTVYRNGTYIKINSTLS
jgi:S1-C subfamily serine protease